MEIGASERGIALAIFGILVSLVLAILTAIKAPTAAIVVCAGATLVLILVLYVPTMQRFYRNSREDLQRRERRRLRHLRIVVGEEADAAPLDLPDGVYGYEEISSVAGLRSGHAKIKPDRARPDGFPYPLEIHKYDGEPWLLGYVSHNDKGLAENASEAGQLTLWMRRTKANEVLVGIPLGRLIDDGQSLGDRSWDSAASNIFRLVLNLAARV